jgi:anti-anti-sigma factor
VPHPESFGSAKVLRARAESGPGGPVLVLAGEIDVSVSGALGDRLRELLADAPERVVVDLGEVGFIDSSGLRTLLQVDAEARAGSSRLVLRNVTGLPRRLMSVTEVDGLLELEDGEG